MMIDRRLTNLLDRNLPRYTSYPTAPHFLPDVGQEEHAAWLDLAAEHGPVSLYLHVPFCRSICHYCGCTTKASLKDEPLRKYAAVLRKEIALVADHVGAVEVSHIHWGGGTPSLMPPDEMDAIVGDLHRFFKISPKAEHAIELDPRHVTSSGAAHLASLGVNRASLGVQDLDPAVQALIGRMQPFSVVEAAMAALRRARIHTINLDLMYGLPGQTDASIRKTAMQAAGLAPARMSLFGYAHVPWFKANQKLIDERLLPGPEDRRRLSEIARTTIDAFGYEAIGIDHFARPDDALAIALKDRTLRRNFQGYTTDKAETLIGLGLSSIGKLPRGYVQTTTDMKAYAMAIEAGRFATVKGRPLSVDDRARADVIEELLCFFDADCGGIARSHGLDEGYFDEDFRALAPLESDGYVRIVNRRVAITRDAAALARLVASHFDSYLGAGGRHSTAT
ncbi:Oxygen-independent coproporphyrinogen-III oxidase [Hartmannibacter diazotrophicus]|uniref:Coproporphyrinogen-III oxidase n=1 Tax=Hartmannibacter diazotrophicus TaxID=1482074 RepID=A0A2C9DDC2_9HYPH|nr:oxygen-independent coproporphyrinogen III oxidase [Hartmannibacter diazotrophicus]SON58314.1 Oxygen-independent coproporphyrinogen-III oxidase [Hartmannibacter diazotrophicus]